MGPSGMIQKINIAISRAVPKMAIAKKPLSSSAQLTGSIVTPTDRKV